MSTGEKVALAAVIILVIIGIIVVICAGFGKDGNLTWEKPEDNKVVKSLDRGAFKLGLAEKEVFGPEALDDMSTDVYRDGFEVMVDYGTTTIDFGTLAEDSKVRRYIAVKRKTCWDGGRLVIHWTPRLETRPERMGRKDDSTDPDWEYYFGMARLGGELQLQVTGNDSAARCSLKLAEEEQ